MIKLHHLNLDRAQFNILKTIVCSKIKKIVKRRLFVSIQLKGKQEELTILGVGEEEVEEGVVFIIIVLKIIVLIIIVLIIIVLLIIVLVVRVTLMMEKGSLMILILSICLR